MKKNRILRIISLMLIWVLVLNTTVLAGTEKNSLVKVSDFKKKPPKIGSEAGIIMDADSGAILYAKNMDKREYPASTTKIMTVLLALENCKMDEKVHFSRKAVLSIERGSSHIGMVPDEEITMAQCLRAIMLASANEVSNAVAEHVAGSMDDFAVMMNKRAKELGCTGTHFVNANGLHDDKHYSTAHDLALILREVNKYDAFHRIAMTRMSYIPKTNITKEKRCINNHNKMIYPGGRYYYEYCTGGKTGYTTKAHHTLVNTAEKDGQHLLAVVMNSEFKTDKWNDTTKLFEYCFKKFNTYKIEELENNSNFALEKQAASGWFGNDDIKNFTYEAADNRGFVTLPVNFDAGKISAVLSENNGKTAVFDYMYDGFFIGSSVVKNNTPEAIESLDSTDDSAKTVKKGKGGVKGVFKAVLTVLIIAAAAVGVKLLVSEIKFRRLNARYRKKYAARKNDIKE